MKIKTGSFYAENSIIPLKINSLPYTMSVTTFEWTRPISRFAETHFVAEIAAVSSIEVIESKSSPTLDTSF